ncbi:BlaI/MecI/CopY family transcriptional regulator [Phycicoccus jejuensis]|uniref:BlaI/MecI/CopY family transcriptional regulator n=1 Tax=Phycicoccus jejuensis TaxID=367299 RepID=UPI00384C5BB0
MGQLGHLESAVMARIWASGRPMLVREVLGDLQLDRPLAYTTVMTVMDNLHKKGLLTRERDGRAYRYQSAQTREQYTAELMEDALASSGNSAATLMHFVAQIAPEELAGLEAAVARARRRGEQA